jgi:CelD/BcsL family acetyltransferase involved in cellulose biosynthesis
MSARGATHASAEVSHAEVFHLEVVDSLEAVERWWPGLSEASGNVFSTLEWLATWWRHFGRDRPLALGICRSPGTGGVRAILPLYLAARRPARVLRLLGHGPTDQLGPVCSPGDLPAAARTLRALLDGFSQQPNRSRWDVLVADELPGAIDWAGELDGRTLAAQASPVARLGGVTGDQWLARRSANLRSALRRGERALDQLGELGFRRTMDPAELDRDLDTLLRLHAARWRSAGGSRAFTGREAFHRDFARQALERGWLRLRFLELDGEPIAALYNLSFAGNESFYQAGRDPRFDRCSVGLVLQAQAIRQAADDGCAEYRFLRGDEPYKRRFADVDAGTSLQSVGVARGIRGRALLAGLTTLPRLPRDVVRRVPASLAWGTGGSPLWSRP